MSGLAIWQAERVRREEPALSTDVVAGLHAATAGVVNPYEVCFSLIESARLNGVEILVDSPIEGITRDGDGVFNLLTGQRVVHASHEAQSQMACDWSTSASWPRWIKRITWLGRKSDSGPTGHPVEHLWH